MKILLIALKDWKHRLKSSVIFGSIMGLVPAILLRGLVKEGAIPISLIMGVSVLSLSFATLILCADLISDERISGTMVFLLSQPLRNWEITSGKHIALVFIMLPAILANSIAAGSAASTDLPTGFLYFVCLFLYTFASGGLLLFVSAQFRRLPAVFGMWCLYTILFSVPGAFFASTFVPQDYWKEAFLVFLVMLPFLTPLIMGLTEFLILYLPFPTSGTPDQGSGSILTLLFSIAENPAASIPNFLVPAWNSTVVLLSGASKAFTRPSIYAAAGSIVTLISMGLLFGFLASKQFRKRTPGID